MLFVEVRGVEPRCHITNLLNHLQFSYFSLSIYPTTLLQNNKSIEDYRVFCNFTEIATVFAFLLIPAPAAGLVKREPFQVESHRNSAAIQRVRFYVRQLVFLVIDKPVHHLVLHLINRVTWSKPVTPKFSNSNWNSQAREKGRQTKSLACNAAPNFK